MKTICIFLLLLCHGLLKAQLFPNFCVYLVSGNVTVDNASQKGKKVIQKSFLLPNDIIRLQKKSELQLFNRSGKFITLNAPGIYKLSDLEDKISSASTQSVTSQYLKLVYEQVLDPHYDISKARKNALGGAIGGTVRGFKCNSLIYPPQGYKTSEVKINFSWASSTHSWSELAIYDAEKKQISSVTINDTQQVINLNSVTKDKTGIYYWVTKPVGMDCDTVTMRSFTILSKKEQQKKIAELTGKTKSNNLIEQLTTISNLEAAGFIDEATERYQRLVKKYPKNRLQ